MQNPQQYSSKLKPTTDEKDHASLSSGIYPRDARILQYIQINHYDTPHQQVKE